MEENIKKRHQFIVAGASTAGKSTFSRELIKKYLVECICIDPIIEGFEEVFPELGITHNALTHDDHVKVCQKFKPFISRVIKGLEDNDFVIEGFRLPIEDLYKEYPNLQYFVFGFPDTTPEEQLAKCRMYDKDNWTNDIEDGELLKILGFLIEESKVLEESCAKIGIPYFDTSKDYRGNINMALSLTK